MRSLRFIIPALALTALTRVDAQPQARPSAAESTASTPGVRARASAQADSSGGFFNWLQGNWNQGIVGTLLSTGLLAIIGAAVAPAVARRRERVAARSPHATHLWALLGEKNRNKADATSLLLAINRGAIAEAEHPVHPSRNKVARAGWFRLFFNVRAKPATAALVWERMRRELHSARHLFVAPGFVGPDGKRVDHGNAIQTIIAWLNECDGLETEPEVGRIAVRVPAGIGKTTFMYRLLLDLSDASTKNPRESTPVPMLASAGFLQRHEKQIAALLAGGDSKRAFVRAWLTNRRIALPKDAEDRITNDFEAGLEDGRIVLLLDGDDELAYQGLGEFARGLLDQVRYWVVAHRPGHGFGIAERTITLHDSLSPDDIARYIDQRWAVDADFHGTQRIPDETREDVKTIVRDLVTRHEQRSLERYGADSKARREAYWLSQPRNLDLYLDAIEKGTLKSRDDYTKAAQNQPRLFDAILARGVKKIGGNESLDEIRNALFHIAITDPLSTARAMTAPAQVVPQSVSEQLRRLSEILEVDAKRGFSFRSSALRSYFIAGEAAHEIIDRPPANELHELTRRDVWSGTKRTSVAHWIHTLTSSHAHLASPAHLVAQWLRDTRLRAHLSPEASRNLLELIVSMELHNGRHRGDIDLSNLDLRDAACQHIDLRLTRPVGCDFTGADLRDAELTQGTFKQCDFTRADLAGADAVGSEFIDCTFGSPPAQDAKKPAKGMAINRARFINRGENVSSDMRALLIEKFGASDERSRYRGKFGEKFFEVQRAFLGAGLHELERDAYLPAIENAISSWTERKPTGPIYMVDLMAGGSYKRVNALRAKFPRLHVLGVDRDPCTQPIDDRFQWAENIEIGARADVDAGEIGVNITDLLRQKFDDADARPHLIVAKKAMHEIDRALQPLLLKECGRALEDGGRLILFEDTPASEHAERDAFASDATLSALDSLHRFEHGKPEGVLVRDDCEPRDVKAAVDLLCFDNDASGRIGFTNTWIMLKDWANQNRHEVQHRYFASVAEICRWAREYFGDPKSVSVNHYRLNPLIFNELGIGHVLDHIERESASESSGGPVAIVERDESHLAEWLWDNERLNVLVDFARGQLKKNPDLAAALDAREESVSVETWQEIEPALGPLARPNNTAPAFNLPCSVLVFEKGPARIS